MSDHRTGPDFENADPPADLLTELPPRSVWHGWGDPAKVKPLPGYAWQFLKRLTGVTPAPVATPPVALDDVRVPQSHLPEQARRALAAAVGDDRVRTDRLSRIEHAGGKSYPDLYRLRTGDAGRAPDAVVLPANATEVAEVLAVCVQHRVAVVPFGGGTSVVGGVDPERGGLTSVISLDLRRLNRLLSVDAESRTAVLQPGMRGPEAEAALREHGLTLGHFPQSHQQASIGGYLVTRSSGQASSGYGRFEENVVAVKVATPTGELVLGGRTPANATAVGPKLLDVVIGSEGLLGVVTEVTLQCHRAPTLREQEAWALPETDAGFAAFRALAQDLGHGLMPDVSRLSDAEETLLTLAQSNAGLPALGYLRARGMGSAALAVFQWEDDDPATLRFRRRRAAGVLKEAGAVRLPRRIAARWMAHRFSGPYQRDHLMDRGMLVETLETATTWDNLPHLYTAVGSAIRDALGERCMVQCHVSHLYDGGASLYFTFVARAEQDPLEQWRRVKRLAGDAISSGGGTISHHHAVGTDHRPWAGVEIGDGGVRMLRALKRELDPTGILNPGKLLPDAPGSEE